MRVAVLGGGGFIGANLVRRLVERGHEVRAVDVTFPDWRRDALEGADCWELDLRHLSQAICAVYNQQVVFHLAADMGGVGYFHSDADLNAAMVNGQITHNVFRAVIDEQVERTFYASSACAYPIECQMTRNNPPALPESWVGAGTPDACYGAEKLHGLRLAAKVPGARVGILHTVYGPLQEHHGRRMKFPAAVATKAIEAVRTGRLELWGDGRQMRSYLYIDDAVDMILTMMSADVYDGPVNIGAAGAATCREIAELCLRIVGATGAEIVTNPDEPSGVLARDCDLTKFHSLYGPTPDRTYTEGFSLFIEWLCTVL